MDFDAIIDDFATQKLRRKPMSTSNNKGGNFF